MPKATQSPITKYIKSAPKNSQEKMKEMLEILRKAVPDAKEVMKWKLPAFSYDRILFMFGAFKKHIGFYPTPAVLKFFEKDLEKLSASGKIGDVAKGSVQFPLDKPLPKGLIKKMAVYRAKDAMKNDAKWM